MNYLVLISLLIAKAYAADADLKRVEDVLDKLDRDIKSIENGETPSSVKASKPAGSIALPKMSIKSDEQSLQSVHQSILEIDRELDQLEADIQRTRQKGLERSELSQRLRLTLRLPSPNKFALKAVQVSLDGFSVYDINQPGGLWLPHQEVPIFEGAVAEGQHKVEVEVTLQRKKEGNLSYLGEDLFLERQTFQVRLHKGRPSQDLVLNVAEKDKVLSLVLEEEKKNL